MADEQAPLTDEERAELERLRAEKAARENAAQAATQKAELERLRAEADADARDAARRERAREYMEPDEDLKMPLAQKLVLLFVALLIAWFVVQVVGGGLITN